MPDSTPAPTSDHRSRIISSVLSPAVRLWLRSQVEQVTDLHLQITGGDRQILKGYIPHVAVAAQKVVYQGLHLSQIQLQGSEIRVNLGQVLRGKPLRLLAIVPVVGEVLLSEADLNASLQAPLLAEAIKEFLLNLLRSGHSDLIDATEQKVLNLQDLRLLLGDGQLTLSTNLVSASGNLTSIVIRTGLGLANSHTLQLEHPQWLMHQQAKRGLPLDDLHEFAIDLGSDVELEQLLITPEQISCRGKINVIPAES